METLQGMTKNIKGQNNQELIQNRQTELNDRTRKDTETSKYKVLVAIGTTTRRVNQKISQKSFVWLPL